MEEVKWSKNVLSI